MRTYTHTHTCTYIHTGRALLAAAGFAGVVLAAGVAGLVIAAGAGEVVATALRGVVVEEVVAALLPPNPNPPMCVRACVCMYTYACILNPIKLPPSGRPAYKYLPAGISHLYTWYWSVGPSGGALASEIPKN
jgi:hypothetical protein